MKTTVYQSEAKWGRPAYLKLVDDKVVFDCSDEEYGPIEFDLELLTEALSKHYYAKPLITQDEYNRRRDQMAKEYELKNKLENEN
jgi:hypothetical protein